MSTEHFCTDATEHCGDYIKTLDITRVLSDRGYWSYLVLIAAISSTMLRCIRVIFASSE